MSIRPVDMQIIVPKTIEYTKQIQGEANKQNFDQQVFTQVAAKHAELQQSMVIETNETENTVNKDGRQKQEQENRKRKNQGKEETNSDEKKAESKGLFDMRI